MSVEGFDNNVLDNNVFDNNEFVLQTGGDGQFIGGGYKIDSMFLKTGQNIMTTLNHDSSDKVSDKVSDLFKNLAVPAGLFYVNQKVSKNDTDCYDTNSNTEHTMLPDDIHDKLFALIEVDKNKKRKLDKKTRKQRNNNIHKKTKRNKI